jgi:hypothetical protein
MRPMNELIRSNDPVLLSFALSLLTEAGIAAHLADGHMSVLEGSIGALSRRLLVPEGDLAAARRVLREAGLGAELRPEDAGG